MIYLDYAATTPISDKSLKVYRQVAEKYFGNTESIHDVGTAAEKVLSASREQLAGYLNAEPKAVFFTGSGSEANYLAIHSLLKAHRRKGRHILMTGAEHSSVRHTLNVLSDEGYEIEHIPLDQQGRVDIKALEQMIREDTVLAAVHHANSEIGTIQDIERIGEVLAEKGVLFHSDCVQSFGKLPIDVEKVPFDSLAVSGHKIYGPKGVGFCYINPETDWKPILPGTVHERGLRPGTVNTPGVAAMAEAADEVIKDRRTEFERLRELREYFLTSLDTFKGNYEVEGAIGEEVMPNIIGMRIEGMEGQYVMSECNRFGVAISTGSACHVSKQEPSATMRALQRSRQESLEFIRFSLGKDTTHEKIDKAIDVLNKIVEQHYKKIYGEVTSTEAE